VQNVVLGDDSNKFILNSGPLLVTFAKAISEEASALATALETFISLVNGLVSKEYENVTR
jgi:hypothetical protein